MGLPHRSNHAGFTLIELMVVVVIISVVSSITLVAFINALDKAKQRATMADMRTLSKGIEAYMVDNGAPPSSAGGVTGLQTTLIPYQTTVVPINDHWRRLYTYESEVGGDYTFESHGKDGVDGANISYATRFDFNLDIVLSNGLFIAAPE